MGPHANRGGLVGSTSHATVACNTHTQCTEPSGFGPGREPTIQWVQPDHRHHASRVQMPRKSGDRLACATVATSGPTGYYRIAKAQLSPGKKAIHRTPTVAATQNLPMKKLGLVANAEIATEDFEAYIRVFKECLTTEQCKLITEMFMQQEAAAKLSKDD
jgi:hypothetical protein